MRFEFMKFADVVYPARFLAVAGGSTPPPPYFNLEEKSMKKVFAFLIFAGLCTAVFLSSPVAAAREKKDQASQKRK